MKLLSHVDSLHNAQLIIVIIILASGDNNLIYKAPGRRSTLVVLTDSSLLDLGADRVTVVSWYSSRRQKSTSVVFLLCRYTVYCFELL